MFPVAGDVGNEFFAVFEDATFFGVASVDGTIRFKSNSIRREGINEKLIFALSHVDMQAGCV